MNKQMGTNYYFYQKNHTKLTEEDFKNNFDSLNTAIGCDENYIFLEHRACKLTNGYMYNNTYYNSLDELNKNLVRKFHIGKSSAGWHFLLAIYPEYGINNLDDWKKLFEDKENYIKNEYDNDISAEEMLDIITNRAAVYYNDYKTEAEYEAHALEVQNDINTALNLRKYATYDELLRDNHAERGKNGLLAHAQDKYTTHTDGTYDYIISVIFS